MSSDEDRPFEYLSGSDGEAPPGPDELRAIVARSGRHHRRAAAVGMAATLIVGGLAGYLITSRSNAATTTVAVTGSRPPATTGVGSGPVQLGGVTGITGTYRYRALFTRTAGGVTIRGFLTDFPQPTGVQASGPGCAPVGRPSFQAELSTAKMVGVAQGLGTADRTTPISAVAAMVTGQPEGDPTAAVVAATGPGVAKVRVAFTGGATDEMAPVQGWVTLAAGVPGAPTSAGVPGAPTSAGVPGAPTSAGVLGAPTSAATPVGTLTALDASGRVLSTQAVTTESGALRPFSAGCGPPCPPLTATTTAAAPKRPAPAQSSAIACTGPPNSPPNPEAPVPAAPPASAPATTGSPG